MLGKRSHGNWGLVGECDGLSAMRADNLKRVERRVDLKWTATVWAIELRQHHCMNLLLEGTGSSMSDAAAY
ncbi:MAG TPA: hypothetical protein VMM76_18715 [Pirellulaceae bacterium]|nr:hypothetical protein [Pirellulaceae bacterium]